MNAQTNLISNASFENAVGCKVGTGIYNSNNAVNNYITGWNRPTSHTGTPYNFTNCANSSNYNTPKNKYGYQQPKTGSKYVGLQTYKTGSNPDRQYIQTQLSSALVAGRQYRASMYVSLGNKSEYATDKIGMYFSQTKIAGAGNKRNLPYTPQVKASSVISDTANWVLVTGTFIATGGEQYLTIGNFYADTNTTKILVSAGSGYGNNRALYYIDDVSLVELPSSQQPPVASFTVSTSSARLTSTGLSVTFTSTSTNNPTSLAWDIDNNGTIDGTTNPFTYSFGPCEAGVHAVKLTATNTAGSNSVVNISAVTLLMPNPIVEFSVNNSGTAPFSAIAGSTVNLTNLTNNFCYGAAYTYNWTISPSAGVTYVNGTNNTSQNVQVTFANTGTYTITLTSGTNDGATASLSKQINITPPPPPVASYTVSPASGTRMTSTGLSVTFTSTSTNNPTSFSWDIDNNGSAEGNVNPFTYIFPVSAAGNHNNKLTATNAGGAGTITNAYSILKPNPSANFTANGSASPISVSTGATVTFTNTTNSFGYTNTYVWNISPSAGVAYVNGTNNTSQNPQVTFANTGTYSVTLTANTDDGGTSSITKTGFITVAGTTAPVANFSPVTATGSGSVTVPFINSSTGNPTSYNWVITPGTLGVDYVYISGASTSANPTIKFNNSGTSTKSYTVALTAINTGGSNTKTVSNCVTVTPAVTYYSRQNGDWNDPSTWSTTGHTGGAATSFPSSSGHNVEIKHKVTAKNSASANTCGTLTIYPGSSSELFALNTLYVSGDVIVKNSTTTGGVAAIKIDSSGSVDADGVFDLNLSSGSFDMLLGSATGDYDKDGTQEDGSFSADRFKINLTGNAGTCTFHVKSSSSEISTYSGVSTINVNASGNSYGGLNFIADWGGTIDFSSCDSFYIYHGLGADLNFKTNKDGSTYSFPTLTIDQKSGTVFWNILDGGIVDIGENYVCNITPAAGNTSATVNMTLGSFYTAGSSDDGVSRDWVAAFDVSDDYIINQIGGGAVNHTLSGYTDIDGWKEGPALSVTRLIINHNATSNINFELSAGSDFSTNSSSLSNTNTGLINFKGDGEAELDFGNLNFMTSKTLVKANNSTICYADNIIFPIGGGSAINLYDEATLKIRGNITRPSGLTDIIKPSTSLNTIEYSGSSPQTILKSGNDISYTILKINNSGGVNLEGNVIVPNGLVLQNGKVNLNTFELTLGTSVSSNGSLSVNRPQTYVVDGYDTTWSPSNDWMCASFPQMCVNGRFYSVTIRGHYESGDAKSWFYGSGTSKFTRWMPSTLTTINSDSALFPMGTVSSPNRFMSLAKTAVTGSGGKVSVTHNDVAGDANVNINDGGTAIKFLTNSNWNVLTAITNASVRFDMRLQGKGLGFSAGLDKIRITKAASVVGIHTVATGDMTDPKGNRAGLTAAQLTGVFYLGSTSTSGTKSFQIEDETAETETSEAGVVIGNLYPNPAVNECFINIVNNKESIQAEIQIMDLTGRIVFAGNQTLETGENNMNINVSGLNIGTYMLRVVSENGNAVKRFVKAE